MESRTFCGGVGPPGSAPARERLEHQIEAPVVRGLRALYADDDGRRAAVRLVEVRQTVYRGHEGVREWLRDLYESLSEFQAEYSDIRDLGDRVVAIGCVRARGAGSEAEIESPHGAVTEFKNGKGVRIRTYLDPEEALEAAGLSG